MRVNQKKATDAYVPGGALTKNDIIITGLADRNRALDGDTVVVELNPRSDWLVLEQDILDHHAIHDILLPGASSCGIHGIARVDPLTSRRTATARSGWHRGRSI